MRKLTIMLLSATLLCMTMAFSCGNPPLPIGFIVLTTITLFGPMGLPITMPQTHVAVGGDWIVDRPTLGEVKGTVKFFSGDSGQGKLQVNDARAPADWMFGEFSGNCAGQTVAFPVRQNDGAVLNCDTTRPRPLGIAFSAIPKDIDINNPPPTVTITGQDMDATHGMPWVEYYDDIGNLVAQGRAFAVASDGTWLTGYTPDLSSVSTGSYTVIVSNVDVDGNLSLAGSTIINVFASTPDPPPDPCGCPGDRACMPCTIY